MRRDVSIAAAALAFGLAAAAPAGAQTPPEAAVTEGQRQVCGAIDRDLAPLILASGDTGHQIASALEAWRKLRCRDALGRAEMSCRQLESGWRAMLDDNRNFAEQGLRKPYMAWVFAKQADFWAPIGCTLNLNGGL